MIEKVEPEKQAGHDSDSDRTDSAGKSAEKPAVSGEHEYVIGPAAPVLMGDDDGSTVTEQSAAIAAVVAAASGPEEIGEEESSGSERLLEGHVSKIVEIGLERLGPVLEEFFESRAVSHEMARQIICEALPELGDRKGFDADELLKDISRWVFYYSTYRGGDRDVMDHAMVLAELKSRLSQKFLRADVVFRESGGRFGGEHDFVDLAVQCPRFIPEDASLDSLGLHDIQDDALEAVRFQVAFSLFTHKVMENGERHREAYFLASIAALLARRAGRTTLIPPLMIEKSTPSIGLLDRFGGDNERLKRFIDARISLLLPDRAGLSSLQPQKAGEMVNIVQEDFIIVDLIAMAKVAGLYDEYSNVFDAILKYRQLQFIVNFHMRPSTSGKRPTLLSALRRWRKNHPADASDPTMVSLGCGDGFTEDLLSEMDVVSGIVGVDSKDWLGDTETKLLGKGGIVKLVYLGANESVSNTTDGSASLRGKVLQECGSGDVVFFGDVLHETDNPMAYLVDVFRKVVKPGGYLYLSDPIHCSAVDGQTKIDLNPFDNTRHPGSMLSLEQYYHLLVYLQAIGMVVESVNISPGAYAGYNDTLWRLSLLARKPEDGVVMSYTVPKHPSEDLVGDDGLTRVPNDIFEVFPLNFIEDEEQRERVRAVLGAKFFKRGVPYGAVRRYMIHRIDDSGEQPRQIIQRRKAEPYRFLPELFEHIGMKDEELVTRNNAAGEVIALVGLLKDVLEIDIGDKLAEQPGWEQYL